MSDAGFSMLGAGAWGWPKEMLWGGRWEGVSCLGTHVRIKDFKIKKIKINHEKKKAKQNKGTNRTKTESQPQTADCQVFPHKRWFYLRSPKDCSPDQQPWGATCKPPLDKERKCFYREDKEMWRVTVNRVPLTFHWLRPDQGRRGFFHLPFALCDVCRSGEGPLFCKLYLIEISVH